MKNLFLLSVLCLGIGWALPGTVWADELLPDLSFEEVTMPDNQTIVVNFRNRYANIPQASRSQLAVSLAFCQDVACRQLSPAIKAVDEVNGDLAPLQFGSVTFHLLSAQSEWRALIVLDADGKIKERDEENNDSNYYFYDKADWSKSLCGNGVINNQNKELCDVGVVGTGESCRKYGYYGGELGCGFNCQAYNFSSCKNVAVTATCKDSDLKNLLKKGEVNGSDGLGRNYRYQDYCSDLPGQVVEYNCTKGEFGWEWSKNLFVCPYGCSNGACNDKPKSNCGNGKIDSNEVCDSTNLNKRTCQSLGYGGGTLECSANCDNFKIDECNEPAKLCGNGRRNLGELCDGKLPVNQNCQNYGWLGAKETLVKCRPDCAGVDLSACGGNAVCGNGRVEAGEACDKMAPDAWTCTGLGFADGDLACAKDCTAVDASACRGIGKIIMTAGEEAIYIQASGQSTTGLKEYWEIANKKQDIRTQSAYMNSYTLKLTNAYPGTTVLVRNNINNFLVYGSVAVPGLSVQERRDMVAAFGRDNKHLPASVSDWTELLTKYGPARVKGVKVENRLPFMQWLKQVYN
jgi:hypothetical protein